jgi:hypothetical protein
MEALYCSAAIADVDDAASSNALSSILFFMSVPAKKLNFYLSQFCVFISIQNICNQHT